MMSRPTLTERVIHLESTMAERVTLLEHTAEQNRACISELADALLGTPQSSLAGGGRKHDGVVHRVERIEHLLSNGGIKVKWGKAQWAATGTVLAALITAASYLIAGA